MNDDAALIALDWGTSSLRAYLISKEGRLLSKHESDLGIMKVPEQDYAAALAAILAGPLAFHEPLPIIAAGMITSRQGWCETPYLPCPATLTALAEGLLKAAVGDRLEVYFVPGLSFDPPSAWPDVMRGEETQVLGAFDTGAPLKVFVLPGTHSKWVRMDAAAVVWFRTFMTGELFATLKDHSILGKLMAAGPPDDNAFDEGVTRGLSGDGILASLFSARSLALFDRLPAAAVEDYLSGLLIGGEIAEMRALDIAGPVGIIGGAELGARYQRALNAAGFRVRETMPDAAATGLYRIAAQAGLMD